MAKPTYGDMKDLTRGMGKKQKEIQKVRVPEKQFQNKNWDTQNNHRNPQEPQAKRPDTLEFSGGKNNSMPSIIDSKLFFNIKKIYSNDVSQVLDNEQFSKTEMFKIMNRIHSDLCNNFVLDRKSWEISTGKAERLNGRINSYGPEVESKDDTYDGHISRREASHPTGGRKEVTSRSQDKRKQSSKSSEIKVILRLTNKKLQQALRGESETRRSTPLSKQIDLQDYFLYSPKHAFEIQQEIIRKQQNLLVESQKELQKCVKKMEKFYKMTFFMQDKNIK